MNKQFYAVLALAALLSTGLAPLANAGDAQTPATGAKQGSANNHETFNRQRARRAHESLVEEAAKSVLAATRLDLDIRLIGHTSETVAARR